MISWLYGVIVGSFCRHEWETVSTGRMINSNGDAIGDYYNLRCTKCGDIKRKNLS